MCQRTSYIEFKDHSEMIQAVVETKDSVSSF